MPEATICEYGAVGYTGHIPGLRDRVGSSYGRLVTELQQPGGSAAIPPWTAPSARRPIWSADRTDRPAGRTGQLGPGHAPCSKGKDDVGHAAAYPIPGYAGFVPDKHEILGKQYIYPCRPEFTYFPRPRHVAITTETGLREAVSNDERKMTSDASPTSTDAIPPGQATDSQQSARLPCMYVPRRTHHVSPYYLPDDDPDKYFPPGYTGAVPRARDYDVGVGYEAMTRRALIRLGLSRRSTMQSELASDDDTGATGVPRLSCSKHRSVRADIYPVETGLVPLYAGHLPGYRWRCGVTFGLGTRNCKSSLQRTSGTTDSN